MSESSTSQDVPLRDGREVLQVEEVAGESVNEMPQSVVSAAGRTALSPAELSLAIKIDLDPSLRRVDL